MDKSNVIILTTGLSGSSLYSNLLSNHGLWCGNTTITKNNFSGQYDTYENVELVSLNDSLLKIVNVDFEKIDQYDTLIFEDIANLVHQIKLQPFKNFIDNCSHQSTWLWKDPRLIHTLGFWLALLGDINFRILYISRRPWNLWVSYIIKRRLIDYSQLKQQEVRSFNGLYKRLVDKEISLKQFYFEDLQYSSTKTIKAINQFLHTDITDADFEKVYKPKLSRSKSVMRQIKAILIYLKNLYIVPR